MRPTWSPACGSGVTRPGGRGAVESTVGHDGWSVETRRAPLGVVGFVFEGRPNVFADACGVRPQRATRSCSGSGPTRSAPHGRSSSTRSRPALRRRRPAGGRGAADRRRASAARGHALVRRPPPGAGGGPRLRCGGRRTGCRGLPGRYAGEPARHRWRLDDRRRGAPIRRRSRDAVEHSLDRKVCNTLNVCAIPQRAGRRAGPGVPRRARRGRRAARRDARLHVVDGSEHAAGGLSSTSAIVVAPSGSVERRAGRLDDRRSLGTEWEWERSPELSLRDRRRRRRRRRARQPATARSSWCR